MAGSLKNVIVIGGSYVGVATSQGLANLLPTTHRVLLIEPHSHFHHLFAFPRFAILPTHEHKAFIPYTGTFAAAAAAAAGGPEGSRHGVVQARVSALHGDRVVLDREWRGSREIPYEHVVVATGTRLRAPGTMPGDDKASSVAYLRRCQDRLRRARSVAVVGGGAVGVQMATDLKEIYPDKRVTLVHSRAQLMPLYHPKLDEIIKERCRELGVTLVLGSRVDIPADEFQRDTGEPITVSLQDGRTLEADVVIPATGQTPNTQFLSALPPSPSEGGSLVNEANGFIRVGPTLQFRDPAYRHLYAVGDVADSGAHKAARPGAAQAQVVARNILAMVEGREPVEEIVVEPPAIHLTLGLTKNLVFANPDPGETEPWIKHRDE
ncbi:putative oxidoreductase [Rosellinia necatrix]|uniref:Putative oxidoreductase n=1 Tax=Rosellinia necatrix TaxID=77044 RepID=A0A1S8A7H5_ROSNE|nr:putative oxidoreductase [Rosellinia necatrix]